MIVYLGKKERYIYKYSSYSRRNSPIEFISKTLNRICLEKRTKILIVSINMFDSDCLMSEIKKSINKADKKWYLQSTSRSLTIHYNWRSLVLDISLLPHSMAKEFRGYRSTFDAIFFDEMIDTDDVKKLYLPCLKDQS